MLATVWGHARYCTDTCSARCCCAHAAGFSRAGALGPWRHQGLVTRGEAQPLYAGRMSRSGHTDGHVHNVASRATVRTGGACRGWCRHVTLEA